MCIRDSHSAVLVHNEQLLVFWTQVGDAPEHIKVSSIDLQGDWRQWRESEFQELLKPIYSWEGANAPVEPSVRSTAYGTTRAGRSCGYNQPMQPTASDSDLNGSRYNCNDSVLRS